MRSRWLCLALQLVLLFAHPQAQTPEPLNHQSWSTEEGLPDASVHSLLQARDGYLWFATEGGAVRFDGYNFSVFLHANQPAFASDDVNAVAQDREGALWFGTADGLVRLEAGTFSRYAETNGLPSTRILGIAADSDGSLVVLTSKGLVAGDARGFHPLPVRRVQEIAITSDLDGAVLFTTEQGEVLRLRDGRVEREAKLPLQDGSYLGVHPGPLSTFWSYGPRFVALDGPHIHRSLTTTHEIPAGRVQTLLAERDGRTWIGTSRGLFLWSTPNEAPMAVAALRDDSILSLLQDREGNLWVGTEASGLHVLRPRKFRAVDGTVGEPVTAVTVTADGTPWVGTRDRGLRRIRLGNAEERMAPSALTSSVILSVAAGPHGELWAGTPDGLNHINPGGVRSLTAADGLPDDFVRSLQADARGTVWAGTRRGLAHIGPGGVLQTLTTADGLGSNSVGALLLPNQAAAGGHPGELWAGTAAGLSHVQGQHVQSFGLDRPQTGQGSGSIVTALGEGSGRSLFVAVHSAGLFLFDGEAFHPIASAQIPHDITSLLPDRLGYLWIRSAQELLRARVSDLEACATRTVACSFPVSAFLSADGLPTTALAAEGSPELALGPDGKVWIATGKGLAVADPAHFPVNDVPPPIVIQSFTVDGATVGTPQGSTQQGAVSIGPGHSRFTFTFAGLSFTMPSRVRYRTLLQGFDRDWVDNGTGRVASYTSLPPRHYRFQVQAQNNDGVWSPEIASVEFVVKRPFYGRWWFYLLLAAGLVLVLLSALRLRERAVQRRFALVLEERNRLAREIHDTLAQDFVSMSLQLEIAAALLKQQQVDKAVAQLGTMRQAIKDGLQAARQSIWDLRASAGEESLPAKLTALASRYAISGKPPRLSIGGAFRALPRSVESEVLRIAQESLTNINRHAEATEASVELQYGTHELRLTVSDNGRGFPVDAAGALQGHYGLRGMRERAAALGAELAVESQPTEGTRIMLRVPLSDKEVSPA